MFRELIKFKSKMIKLEKKVGCRQRRLVKDHLTIFVLTYQMSKGCSSPDPGSCCCFWILVGGDVLVLLVGGVGPGQRWIFLFHHHDNHWVKL